MGAPLVGTAPIFALSFFGFDWGKQLVKDISGTGSKDLNALQLAAAGGFSGILTTTIMAPGERIKCILQVRINWPALYIYQRPDHYTYQVSVYLASISILIIILSILIFKY